MCLKVSVIVGMTLSGSPSLFLDHSGNEIAGFEAFYPSYTSLLSAGDIVSALSLWYKQALKIKSSYKKA